MPSSGIPFKIYLEHETTERPSGLIAYSESQNKFPIAPQQIRTAKETKQTKNMPERFPLFRLFRG